MKPVIANLKNIPRRFQVGFPVSRIGYRMPGLIQGRRVFSDKLEFCLRLTSADGSPARDELDGVSYVTPFPHVLLKLPHSEHVYEVETEREAVYVQYSPELEAAMRKAGLFEMPRIWPVRLTPEIRSLLQKIRDDIDRLLEPGVIDQIDLLAMQLVQELIGQDSRRDEVPRELRQKIDRIATYFHLHFAEDFDLDKLLRSHGLSRRTFQRYWVKFHELPPTEYLRELKLQHVRTQLAESSLPVHAIAREANFRYSYYMCRLFRERFGMTPLQYRRRASQGE